MKQVLYLSYDGMTDPLGQGQVLSYLRGLSQEGFNISLISFEKPERFAKGKDEITLICQTNGINWYPLMYTKKPPVLSTVYDVYRMLSLAKKLHRQKKFDLVHCRSYIAALAGLDLKKQYGIPFIFDMRGFWIDEKIEAGDWDINKAMYRKVVAYLRKKEEQYYQHADVIVTLTQAAKQTVILLHPHLDDKISVAPTCVNLDVFPPFKEETRQAVRAKLGIPANAFVLLYSGGYGANYDIDFLLRAFDSLREKEADACLLILSKDGVTGLEGKTNTKNIFSASLPYSQVAEYLMAGDLGVINYVNKFSVAGRSPTKLGEYWACGLSAVAPAGVGDVDALFARFDEGGFIFREPPFPKELNDLKAINKEKLRGHAEEYFSLTKGIQSYKNIYQKITG